MKLKISFCANVSFKREKCSNTRLLVSCLRIILLIKRKIARLRNKKFYEKCVFRK